MTEDREQEWIDRHDREHEDPTRFPDCEQCRVYIADATLSEAEALYLELSEQANLAAEAVTSGAYIAGFSGIDKNTRRIAKAAALKAALIALNVTCPECGQVGSHRFMCGHAE